MSKSIFQQRRFELQSSHLYFLPPKIGDELRVEMPVFLVGLRGTGKTTLLQSQNWSQRLRNEVYKSQLEEKQGSAFFDRVLGVYTKLPESKVSSMGRWLDDQNPTSGGFFSLYLDLLWIELALEAVAGLSVEGVLIGTVSDEHEAVEKIAVDSMDCPAWKDKLDILRPKTFMQLSTAFRKLRQELEFFSEASSPQERALPHFRPLQFGEVGKIVADHLVAYCDIGDSVETASEKGWSIRVCMDEGEHLSFSQQETVNTVYRLARWPLFYSIAYVELPDVTTTQLDGLTLSVADRKLVELKTQSDAEFREYVEGVVNVRARAAMSDTAVFSVETLFGKMDLDQIIDSILRESVSKKAKELIEASEKARVSSNGYPPYLKTYYEQFANDLKSDSVEGWEQRRDDSAGYRKKFVAAYLALCREFKSRVRYAYSEMVLQVSDKCVRDFLSQLHEVFMAANTDIDKFLAAPVPWQVQDKGMREASLQKRKSFGSMLCVSGADNLIDGLGQITSMLQSQPGRNLSSPELGKFSFRRSANALDNTTSDYIDDIVYDAILSGFIRFSDSFVPSQDDWTIQLHASLAPHYQFSYRGAMYECEIKRSELKSLMDADSIDTVNSEAKRIAKRIGANFEEYPLFGDEEQ